MPQELNLPAIRQDSGVDDVDVMGFLNIKRAESLNKKHSSEVDENKPMPQISKEMPPVYSAVAYCVPCDVLHCIFLPMLHYQY